mgnify:CR=1 FL=1
MMKNNAEVIQRLLNNLRKFLLRSLSYNQREKNHEN